MTDCSYLDRLGTFYDGELDPLTAEEVENHVRTCALCRAELREIGNLSVRFDTMRGALPPEKLLARAHGAIDDGAGRPGSQLLWIAGMLSGLAASVLVIGSAWLADAPGLPAERPAPRVVVLPLQVSDWERVAMTLRVDPLPGVPTDAPDRQMLADARLADWMLRNLSE